MKVKSKPGTQCPKEGKPREYITDGKPVNVPDTAFYKRLVRDGSLVLVTGKAQRPKAKDKNEKPEEKKAKSRR